MISTTCILATSIISIRRSTKSSNHNKRVYNMKKAYMILDLQFGSTGKGALAGYLAMQNKPDVVVTAWGPNAGHTFIDAEGRTYIHRMLANGIVSPNLKCVLIGPGSVVDLDILAAEIISCKDHLRDIEIIIHPKAAIVTKEHVEIEKRNVTIGSTMKGTGAAVIQRIVRDPFNINIADNMVEIPWIDELESQVGCEIWVSDVMYDVAIDRAECIQIEGAQGYSLSIYHGFYPYTTSRDVTPAQVLADCAIPFGIVPEVYGTLRTYPIRVSNREKDGEIFTSGPCYSDQREMEWSDLGMAAELTTVTKLPRRIFTFSMEQLEAAVRQCNPTAVFLNFANYMDEDSFGDLMFQIDKVVPVKWAGYGPTIHDIQEVDHGVGE